MQFLKEMKVFSQEQELWAAFSLEKMGYLQVIISKAKKVQIQRKWQKLFDEKDQELKTVKRNK